VKLKMLMAHVLPLRC